MGLLSSAEKESIRLRSRIRFPWDPESKLQIGIALEGGYAIIFRTLGTKWAEKNLSPRPNSSHAGFMKRGLASEQDRLEHVDRVIMLAESIDKLWDVPNFPDKLKDLQTKSLEETYFELQIARSLLSKGLLTKFVVPSGARNEDYDLLVSVEGEPVAVEIKCRTGESAFNDTQLLNPLKRAGRIQLPKDGPGIIFLKLSSSWLSDSAFLNRADQITRRFLRDYSRVNAVFLYWEEWKRSAGFLRFNRFKAYINERPKKAISGIEKLKCQPGSNSYQTKGATYFVYLARTVSTYLYILIPK